MNDQLTILEGDALARLREMPDESVQCCVTSPPYWGLRDYGTATWEGGSADCNHKQGRPGAGRADGIVDDRAQRNRDGVGSMGGDCQRCGAKRIDAQIGLEKTPQEFVAKMVDVFSEVRRVLKRDGTCWLNLGDSYATGAGAVGNCPGGGKQGEQWKGATTSPNRLPIPGLKPKDLCGIPWRVAFALQADGWYLRSDIIWSKPNPMPESVTDRPTKAHEYLFLLTKSERYYYDAEAIREDGAPASVARYGYGFGGGKAETLTAEEANGPGTRTRPIGTRETDGRRNKRSVWTVPTFSFSEAHFATYPPALITPCILAGSRPGDTILDPFGGSGTTGQVAIELGRRAVLIELNPEYVKLIERRCNVTPGLAL